MTGINDIDATGIEMLTELYHYLDKRQIRLRLASVKLQVWQRLERAGFTTLIGSKQCFLTDADVIRSYAPALAQVS